MKDKYTFRREFTDLHGQVSTVEHTVEDDTLDEVMMSFLYFLNGCSFTYVKDLIWVREDGQEISVTDWEHHNEQSEPQTAEDLNQLTLELSDIVQKAEDDVNLDNIIQRYADK